MVSTFLYSNSIFLSKASVSLLIRMALVVSVLYLRLFSSTTISSSDRRLNSSTSSTTINLGTISFSKKLIFNGSELNIFIPKKEGSMHSSIRIFIICFFSPYSYFLFLSKKQNPPHGRIALAFFVLTFNSFNRNCSYDRPQYRETKI